MRVWRISNYFKEERRTVPSFRFFTSFFLFTSMSLAASVGWAQGSSGGDLFGGSGGDNVTAITVSAQFAAPAGDRPGQLSITATMKPGWHIYSLTQKPGGPIPSAIKLTPPAGVHVGKTFEPSPPPKKKKEPAFDNLEVELHEGTVTWHATLTLDPGIDPATLSIPGELTVQACDPQSCYPPHTYPFAARLGKSPAKSNVPLAPVVPSQPTPPKPPETKPTEAQPAEIKAPEIKPSATDSPPVHRPNGAAATRLPWRPFTTVAALGKLTGGGIDLDQIHEHLQKKIGGSDPKEGGSSQKGSSSSEGSAAAAGGSSKEILGFIVFGFLGGLILNIMPCVLPVIGLKILSFLEQSGHDRRKAFMLNVWYSLGLLAVFLVLATLAVSPQKLGWGQLFTMPAFTITLAAVVFVMGLSFLGIWELPIPGFAGRGKASELAAQEGATGAFVKGALTTVLATPCTAPFLCRRSPGPWRNRRC